jgi:hypothetical protein
MLIFIIGLLMVLVMGVFQSLIYPALYRFRPLL